MTEVKRRSVKEYNRNRVFRLIASRERISKQEIAAELDLSLPTTTQNLNSLKEEGLIKESGSFESQVGRRAKAISIVSNCRVAIGLDITPHHISLVLADLNGTIIDRRRKSFTISDHEESYAAVKDDVEVFMKQNSISPAQVLGLGISIPGIISFDKKTILNSANLPLPDNFCEHIQKYFSFPCHLFNDASCAGIAEFWRNDYGNDTIAYLLLSNTVGGAILVNGSPHTGMNNRSAEFGHITIRQDGEQCSCGRYGCAEIYCSALALSEHTDNNLELFFEKLAKGNKKFEMLMSEYLQNLAILINDINMCLDCQVVLGGYMGAYLKQYLEQIRKLVGERCTFETDGSYVQSCVCEFEAAALGAALTYIEEFIEEV